MIAVVHCYVARMRGIGRAARRGGLVLAYVLILAACVPFSGDTQSPGPTGEQLDYTIDLPTGWNDLTDEYLKDVPDSVLSGYWTMADDLSTDGPYVTMSMHELDPNADLSTMSEDAAAGWQDQLENSTRGDSGYAETVDGGVITWASISGDLNGERRTEHVAHILYGPYFMYVEVDTPEGDEVNAHAILDALSTVTITGPIKVGDRAGAPVAANGKWDSYCSTIQAASQAHWQYEFSASEDSHVWDCPVDTDYLGQWSIEESGQKYEVAVERAANMTLAEQRAENSIPDAVGGTAKTPNGSVFKLLAEAPFEAPGGGEGVRIDLSVTIPDSTTPFLSSAYLFEDSAGGVTTVYANSPEGKSVPETAWLEPFIATITTSSAS